MSWVQKKIGDFVEAGIADLQTGPFGTQLKASEYTSEGTPVINVRNVGFGDLRPEKLEYLSDAKVNALRVHVLNESDIVFGRKGAVERHLFVQPAQVGWVQGSDCIRLRFTSEEIVPRFISYAFRRQQHQDWMLAQCGNKATMHSLNQDVIKRIPLRIPDAITQRTIVSKLSAYDDLIENNRRRIALLEEAASLLYREWFVHFRFPGNEHIKIIDGVPKGWSNSPMVELAEMVMGQSPKSEFYNMIGEGLPFHQGVTNYGFRFVSDITYSTKVTKIAEAGDILFSVRAPVGRINITLNKMIVGRGLSAFRSKKGNQSFLLYQLKNHFFKEDLIGSGAIYAATNKKELEKLELLQPTDELVEAFEQYTVPIDDQIKALSLKTDQLVKARDLLLPRLMDGRLEI